MKKIKITLGCIIPIIALYLLYAFVALDPYWVLYVSEKTRIGFVLLLLPSVAGSVMTIVNKN